MRDLDGSWLALGATAVLAGATALWRRGGSPARARTLSRPIRRQILALIRKLGAETESLGYTDGPDLLELFSTIAYLVEHLEGGRSGDIHTLATTFVTASEQEGAPDTGEGWMRLDTIEAWLRGRPVNEAVYERRKFFGTFYVGFTDPGGRRKLQPVPNEAVAIDTASAFRKQGRKGVTITQFPEEGIALLPPISRAP